MAAIARKIPALAAPIGGILGLMGAEDEAQAAADPKFLSRFYPLAVEAQRALAKGREAYDALPKQSVYLGTMPERAKKHLQEIHPGLTSNELFVDLPHGGISRLKSKMTIPQMGRMYMDAADDEIGLAGIRNMPGNGRTPSALWHQMQRLSGFYPIDIIDGAAHIVTGMPMETKVIQNYLLKNNWGVGGRILESPIERNRQKLLEQAGLAIPPRQPFRLPAVTPQFGEGILANALRNATKSRVVPPALVGMGILDAMTPTDAQGRQAAWLEEMTRKQALQEPAWSPVDMLLAPIGVAGTGAKMAWAAATPFVNSAVNGILDWFGRD